MPVTTLPTTSPHATSPPTSPPTTTTSTTSTTDDLRPAVDLRATFGQAAASAWVVTGAGPRGPVGFTAISVVSVSLEPPIVSFNISRASSSLATIARSGAVALHLLATHQSDLAHRFARDRSRRFVRDGAWTFDTDGLPELLGVSARLVGRIEDLVDAGDSFVALARVESTNGSHRGPLLHHAGRFTPLTATIGNRP